FAHSQVAQFEFFYRRHPRGTSYNLYPLLRTDVKRWRSSTLLQPALLAQPALTLAQALALLEVVAGPHLRSNLPQGLLEPRAHVGMFRLFQGDRAVRARRSTLALRSAGDSAGIRGRLRRVGGRRARHIGEIALVRGRVVTARTVGE